MTNLSDQTTWKALYDACTPADREEIAFIMLRKIDARRREKLAALMANPRQLESMPVSDLREVADVGVEDAHAFLVSALPDYAGLLVSLECLTAFSLAKDEPTAADLRDVVSSLEDVWKAAGGKYVDDLIHPSKESQSARAGRRPGRKSKGKPSTVSTETKARKA
jgi:hypothetical protein